MAHRVPGNPASLLYQPVSDLMCEPELRAFPSAYKTSSPVVHVNGREISESGWPTPVTHRVTSYTLLIEARISLDILTQNYTESQRMSGQIHDISINNLTIDLKEQQGDIPVAPVVYSLDVSLTSEALEKAVAAVLVLTKEKQPIDVGMESASFTESGAEIEVTAGLNRFLRAKATAVLSIVAENSHNVAVALTDLRTLGKIPIDGIAGPQIDKALATAAEIPGISLDPNQSRGLLIEPNALLAHFGVPLTFAAGGSWSAVTGADFLTVRFSSGG